MYRIFLLYSLLTFFSNIVFATQSRNSIIKNKPDDPRNFVVIDIEPDPYYYESIICPEGIHKKDIQTIYNEKRKSYIFKWTHDQLNILIEDYIDEYSNEENIEAFLDFVQSLQYKKIISISETYLGLEIKVGH